MSEEINNNDNLQENNNNEIKETTQQIETNNLKEKNSNILKFVVLIIVIFLATFMAVYFVVDKAMHNLGITPLIVSFNQMEKIFDESSKYLDNNSPAPVKIEEKNGKYIITINLKSFDNNPDNINVSVDENGIKINGMIKKVQDNETSEKSFYQSVIFPKSIDEENYQKEIKGNKMILTLPLEK